MLREFGKHIMIVSSIGNIGVLESSIIYLKWEISRIVVAGINSKSVISTTIAVVYAYFCVSSCTDRINAMESLIGKHSIERC